VGSHERGHEHLVVDAELSELRRLELPLDRDAAAGEPDPFHHERPPLRQVGQFLRTPCQSTDSHVCVTWASHPTGNPVPPIVANLDQWDGYAPQRTRLLTHLAAARVPNPVVLAGDIHSTWFSELRTDFDRPDLRPVAVEFTATSVSSDFPIAFDAPLKALNPTLNPHVRYFDGSRRGYLRCSVTRSVWHTDVRTVETIDVRRTPVSTTASYAVESGTSTLTSA
jgi:phosphodiesterase/alkaline phosphatase D-like protein